MIKILQHSIISGALSLIVLGFLPVQFVQANPIPTPYPFTYIGTEFNGTQVKFKCANVTLDVYSDYTRGAGTYVIENLANSTNDLLVTFIAWKREVNLTAVMVNQTPYSFSVNCKYSCSYMYRGIIQLNFPPNGTLVLQIWWNFTSVDSIDEYYWFPEHIKWTSYNTGYFINGGHQWGGIPIEWEDVRFNFHTDAYFTSARNISVTLNYTIPERSIQLPLDSNGIPYYQYHAENINESIIISIENVPFYMEQDDFAISMLCLATGVAIGIPMVFRKKVKNHAKMLSIFGFCCFIAFIKTPFFDFLKWGIIMLVVYLTGASIILLHYFLSPRLQNRTYRLELRDRIRRA